LEVGPKIVPETSPVDKEEADNDGEAGNDDGQDGDQVVLVGVDEVVVHGVRELVGFDCGEGFVKGHVMVGAVIEFAKPVHYATKSLGIEDEREKARADKKLYGAGNSKQTLMQDTQN
jgi:hypothetical protein